MLALKKYSKSKSKGACMNYSKSYITCAFINVSVYKNMVKMHAHMKMSASKTLTIGARRALHSALLLSQAEDLVLILVLPF